ncbi:MAG: transcriptional repressor [Firmicutes bacterium]|nr:transcriptional repressor [Bacillota bacterium]MCM1400748.1 transcriptional repressor [Bacteroides sp.]MCM1476833.1 transcriptional repressor [Bacteroides sp.]
MDSAEQILEQANIKPTANRILVVRELMQSPHPLSLIELEERIDSIDKSSVFRVLNILLEHHAVHAVEDGRGIAKYELCHTSDPDCSRHMHVHFYCEQCRQVYCFQGTPAPAVSLPHGFTTHSVNYMLKGICPNCQNNNARKH